LYKVKDDKKVSKAVPSSKPSTNVSVDSPSPLPSCQKEADAFFARLTFQLSSGIDTDLRKATYESLHRVMIFLNDLQGGNIPLGEVMHLNRRKELRDFELWLSQFEVFGSRYHVKEHASLPFFVSTQQREAGKDLDDVLEQAEGCLDVLRTDRDSNAETKAFVTIMQTLLRGLVEHLLLLKHRMQTIIEQQSFKVMQAGFLVPMTCGHRGKPFASEEKLLDNLIKESGFAS